METCVREEGPGVEMLGFHSAQNHVFINYDGMVNKIGIIVDDSSRYLFHYPEGCNTEVWILHQTTYHD